MNTPDDPWSAEVDQKRAAQKASPVIDHPDIEDTTTTTLYGDVFDESSDTSQSCEEGREDNNSGVRRIDNLLGQLKTDKYPPLAVWMRRRENIGRTSIDYCQELLILVTELKGHLKEDRLTMKSSIAHFNYIHASEQRRLRQARRNQ